jgi:hypothetical protein
MSRPKPTLTAKAADMPFQMAWTLDASTLQSTDARRLFDALRIELYGLKHCPFYCFSDDGKSMTVNDPTAEVLALIESLVARFNDRHNAQDDEGELLPSIPLRAQIKAYLMPQGRRRIDAEVPPVVKHGEWYTFTIKLPSTDACILFLRRWKLVACSPSMAGHSSKVRGRRLTVKTRHKQLATNLHYCAGKLLPHDRGGLADAVCPLLLWVAYLVAPGEE